MKATYQEIPFLIRTHREFKGNCITAILEEDNYKVYSYSTLIYKLNFKTDERYFNEKIYSQTTSRLQNIIRKELYGN